MSPEMKAADYAAPLLASKDFFNRSTRVLDEADSAFRPQVEMMTVAQQVAHVAQTLEWFVDGVNSPTGFDLDFEKHGREVAAVNSLTEARKWLDQAYTKAIEFARTKTPQDMSAPLPPGPIMGGEPLVAVLGAMVEHTAHHRGALTVYSRLLGKTPPMPYGG